MARIEKKVWPEYFQKILDGKKTYELRLADFECQEGDVLVLREWNSVDKQFTGRVLEKAGVQVDSAEVSMQPKTTILLGEKEAIQTLRMVERLEELDDIQKVYFNADFDAEVLEKV